MVIVTVTVTVNAVLLVQVIARDSNSDVSSDGYSHGDSNRDGDSGYALYCSCKSQGQQCSVHGQEEE